MSENPSQDQPASDPLGNAGAEGDVNALLAGAAELAADLCQEVGADAPDRPSPGAELDRSPDGAQPGQVIDDQLDQIDSLLDQACQELGPEQPDDATSGPASESEPPRIRDAVTTPPQATAAATTGNEARSVNDMSASSGVLDLDGVPDYGHATDFDDIAGASQAPARAEGAAEQRVESADPQVVQGPPRRLWRLVDKALDVLDLMDRPVTWVGYETRILIGWIALMTLIAALSVFATSLLG